MSQQIKRYGFGQKLASLTRKNQNKHLRRNIEYHRKFLCDFGVQ